MRHNQPTIAMLTIGQAPRNDVVPAMKRYLPDNLRIVEHGALDGLSTHEIDRFTVRDGEVGIVTQLQDGFSVLLSHERILPAMQEKVDIAINKDNATLIVILCGADWSALKSARLIVNPGTLFPGIIGPLAAGRTLGIIKPSPGQIEKEQARYAAMGINAVVTAASPYDTEQRLTLVREAATRLRDANCELIWMTCVGMDAEMRDAVADITEVPVILAHRLLAGVVTELIENRVTASAPS